MKVYVLQSTAKPELAKPIIGVFKSLDEAIQAGKDFINDLINNDYDDGPKTLEDCYNQFRNPLIDKTTVFYIHELTLDVADSAGFMTNLIYDQNTKQFTTSFC